VNDTHFAHCVLASVLANVSVTVMQSRYIREVSPYPQHPTFCCVALAGVVLMSSVQLIKNYVILKNLTAQSE
jgi:hypothetical protein